MLSFWLFVALAILIAAVWKPFKKLAIGGLDSRADKIRQELDDAQRLHEEAKELLAKYNRQLHEGEDLANQIMTHAEEETKRVETKMRADLDALIERRKQQALDRIAQEEQRAVLDVRTRAADLSVRTVRQLLTEKMGGDAAGKVMQDAIKEVQTKLA